MPVTAYWYAKAFVNVFTRLKNIDYDTNAVKLMLTTSAYVPNQDTQEDKADVTNEVTGTGYTAGGETLASKTLSNTNNVVTLDAADVTWSNSTITARRAVLYDDSGATDADKAVLLWIDFGQDESSSNGDFTVQWNASGIATVTPTDAAGFP